MTSVTFWLIIGGWFFAGMVAFSIAVLDDDLRIQADEVQILFSLCLIFGPVSIVLALVALYNNRK